MYKQLCPLTPILMATFYMQQACLFMQKNWKNDKSLPSIIDRWGHAINIGRNLDAVLCGVDRL